MYIRQGSVKQRLGSLEGVFGFFGQVLPTTNFKVTSGYTLKQNGSYYYLLNSKGQQASSQFTVDQIKSAGGIKDYQGKVGLTYYPTAPSSSPAPSSGGSVFNLNLGPAGCQASKASTCDISGQCYDRSGCPITQEESQRLYATPTPAPTPTPAASTGPSATEIMSGVGSILSAFAAPAAAIFQTSMEAKTAKAALKAQQQQQQATYTGSQQPTIIQQGPSTGLILGIVGGFAVMAVVLILVLKKK